MALSGSIVEVHQAENQNSSSSLSEVRLASQAEKDKRTACVLPYIDSFKSPIAGSSHSAADCLPQELLLSLKRQQGADPALKGRSLALANRAPSPTAPNTHPPANVWNYPKRWRRLKHLTDQSPCICGAGKDISFLYDAETARDDDNDQAKASLPTTLIPEEYHIIKHPGVRGLEFHADTHGSQTEKHDQHMTIFPSMKPTGRHEVLALKHTMDELLKSAGIPETLEDSDLCGPSQMHRLLDLVHKEQVIYNICFHEIIRQVTVHCAERGELLANLRQRYNNLIDRIPRQVKSLHDEVMAQRALDKRLTAELKKFKSTISALTHELAAVKDHDLQVTEQSKDVHDNLSSALAESEKNSNLLVEYHNLYELQRKRLEAHISSLTAECALWQDTAHSLAHTVAERLSLQSIQRLQLMEKAWSKMAAHFAILLSDQDTKQVADIYSNMQQWKERVVNMSQRLQDMEVEITKRVEGVEDRLAFWSSQFSDTGEDAKVLLTRKQMEGLWSDLKGWQDTFIKGVEQFSGEVLHERQEELKHLRALVQTLTDMAVQLFTRHKHLPDSPNCPEHDTLLSLVSNIEAYTSILDTRLSGENGVAAGLIRLMGPLETWDTKLNLALHKDSEKLYLAEADWLKLRTALREWFGQVKTIHQCVGSSPQQEASCPPLEQLIAGIEKWHSSLSHMVDIRDNDNTEQVSLIHTALVKWTVELLLKMASDTGKGSKEGAPSLTDLKVTHAALSDRLTVFTAQLTASCVVIVRDLVDSLTKEGYTDADEEQKELKKLRDEAGEWVKLADILLGEVAKRRGEEEREEEEISGDNASIETKSGAAVGGGPEPTPVLPQTMNVLGVDGNIHSKSVQKAIEETTLPTPASPSQLGLATEAVLPEGRGPNVKDVERLVLSLDQTEKKLMQQQELTRQCEERASRAEKEQAAVRERLVQCEAELEQVRAQVLAQSGTNKGKGGKKPGRQTTPPSSRTDKKKT